MFLYLFSKIRTETHKTKSKQGERMTEKEIKANLNKKVIYNKAFAGLRIDCILTGGIIRKGKDGRCFYQAELTEIETGCVIYARLEDVETIER